MSAVQYGGLVGYVMEYIKNPSCPKCYGMQVQLVRADEYVPNYKCRKCHHKFIQQMPRWAPPYRSTDHYKTLMTALGRSE